MRVSRGFKVCLWRRPLDSMESSTKWKHSSVIFCSDICRSSVVSPYLTYPVLLTIVMCCLSWQTCAMFQIQNIKLIITECVSQCTQFNCQRVSFPLLFYTVLHYSATGINVLLCVIMVSTVSYILFICNNYFSVNVRNRDRLLHFIIFCN